MKANQYNAFKPMRQAPTSTTPKPTSAYLQRAQLPPEPPGRASKEINYRSSPKEADENRVRPPRYFDNSTRNPANGATGQTRADEPGRQPANYFPAKRPSSINTPPEDYEQYKSRGIGLTSKAGRPASGAKLRDPEDRTSPRNNDYASFSKDESGNKHGLVGSSSHGRLLQKYRVASGGGVNTPTNMEQRKHLKEDYGYSKELSEYQKLHEKLNSLESKIADMKSNLEKKRVEKQTILEKEQKERKLREAERHSKEKLAVNSGDSPKYRRNPPPELGKEALAASQKEEKPVKSKEAKEAIPKPETALKGIVTQVPKQNKELHSLNFNPYSPRHNMYYVSEVTRAYKDQKSLVKEHLLTSMHILRIMESIRRATNQEMADKMVTLPKKDIYKDKKTVVFDLDETLIHCNENTNIPYDVKLPITFPTGEVVEAGINIRPHATDLIRNLSKNFEVIVFTASHSCYANVVLDHLDPHGEFIQHRLYREHCYATAEGMYVKDLRVLNRNLSDMVLIDNAAYSYAFQLDNGIPIVPYYEGRNDFQLKALQTYLEGMLWVKDVREVNRNTFKLAKYRDYDDPDVLVRELYGEWIV